MTDGAIPEIRRWTAEHAAPADVTLWAPDGLPEFRPGDDLAGILAEALPGRVRHNVIDSPVGHDGFLTETEKISAVLADFLND